MKASPYACCITFSASSSSRTIARAALYMRSLVAAHQQFE
jgi:hypothetical protein